MTKDIWRAVIVAGAMLGAGAACSSAQKEPAAAPTAVPAEPSNASGEERMGTGSGLGESEGGTGPETTGAAAKPIDLVVDAGVPDAALPPDAAPAKRPRSDGKKRPSGRGFIIA